MACEGLRGGGETGTDAEVIGPPVDGGTGFGDVVGRRADDRGRAGDAADQIERQVVGAEMDPAGPGRHGDVGTVVDDDQCIPGAPVAGQRHGQPDPFDEDGNGERLVAHLDHPHAGIEQAPDEVTESSPVVTAVDEHAQRDPGEPIAGAGDPQRRPFEVVEPVTERLEAGRERRLKKERTFLEAPQRLRRAGAVGGDEIGRRPSRQRADRPDPRADIPGDVTEPDPVGKRVGGEKLAEVMPKALGPRGEVGVVEHEPEHVLHDPQCLGGPIGGGVDGPPDAAPARPITIGVVEGKARRGWWAGGIAARGFGGRCHGGVVPPRASSGPSGAAVEGSPRRRFRPPVRVGPAPGSSYTPAPFLPPLPPAPSPGVVVSSSRSLTLLWPGLPWVWLRGSVAGLILAIAFAVVLDMAILLTCVWTELVTEEFTLGLWAATAGVWVVATISAATAFPPPLPTGRSEAAETLFLAARDAYLARDWLAAETKLRALLVVAPTDGEAQLLLATLLRRVGRRTEARTALETLSRSDGGRPWLAVIRRDMARLDAAPTAAEAKEDGSNAPVVLHLPPTGSPGVSAAGRAA